MSQITADDVKKVANLARLKLTDQEVKKFTEQLGNILNHVHELSKLDIRLGESKNSVTQKLRIDEVTNPPAPAELLSNANNGRLRDKYIVTGKIQ